jgi:hypothetical protein
MLRRKFDSPIDDALAATLRNRLWSAVYAALEQAIAYHDDGDQAEILRRHWQDVGAWFVAEELICSAQTDWEPGERDFPQIFCVHSDTAQFLRCCTQSDIVATVQFWLDGVPLDPRIDPDPYVEDTKVRGLRELRSGLNR